MPVILMVVSFLLGTVHLMMDKEYMWRMFALDMAAMFYFSVLYIAETIRRIKE